MIERWAVELIRAAEGTPDRNADYEEIKERIMPVLLTSDHFDATGGAMVGEPVIDGLHVAYVIDGDRTIAHIPEAQFKKWKVSLDDLHDRRSRTWWRSASSWRPTRRRTRRGR